MPLSTITGLNQHHEANTQPSSSSNASNNQMVMNNPNLLHVKFHVNKFQDNLLSKRLQQLNVEEMKLRLKHQRTSNELVLFLKECQQSTGYLSKMKQIDNNNTHVETRSLRDNQSNLSNAVKNMINASILVVDTSHSNNGRKTANFESKSCQEFGNENKKMPRSFSTAKYSSSLGSTAKVSANLRRKSSSKSRARSQTGHKLLLKDESESNANKLNINFHHQVKNSTPLPPNEANLNNEQDEKLTCYNMNNQRNSKSATVSSSHSRVLFSK